MEVRRGSGQGRQRAGGWALRHTQQQGSLRGRAPAGMRKRSGFTSPPPLGYTPLAFTPPHLCGAAAAATARAGHFFNALRKKSRLTRKHSWPIKRGKTRKRESGCLVAVEQGGSSSCRAKSSLKSCVGQGPTSEPQSVSWRPLGPMAYLMVALQG